MDKTAPMSEKRPSPSPDHEDAKRLKLTDNLPANKREAASETQKIEEALVKSHQGSNEALEQAVHRERPPRRQEQQRRKGGYSGHARQQTQESIKPETGNFFTQCQQTLDEFYDARERVVKASRDVTALSKKLIFHLHRLTPATIHNESRVTALKLEEIHKAFFSIVTDLQGHNAYRLSRSIGPGIEEYVEAIATHEYLKNGRLIALPEIQAELDAAMEALGKKAGNKDAQKIVIEGLSYALGIADMTGELMRMAINGVATGQTDQAQNICLFLREVAAEFSLLSHPVLNKKMSTLHSSLAKVEAACYTLRIRAFEFPNIKIKISMDELNALTSSTDWRDSADNFDEVEA